MYYKIFDKDQIQPTPFDFYLTIHDFPKNPLFTLTIQNVNFNENIPPTHSRLFCCDGHRRTPAVFEGKE